MVLGYKCFNADLTNSHGFQFEVGKSYSTFGEVKPGVTGRHGYHMCMNIEDTFRYFGGINNSSVAVCLVIGSGDIVSFSDDYYGYYDMYAVEKIQIVRKLDRSEIIDMVLNFQMIERVLRFVQTFKLLPSEIELFEDKFNDNISIINAIEYYQKENYSVYEVFEKEKQLGFKRVKKKIT